MLDCKYYFSLQGKEEIYPLFSRANYVWDLITNISPYLQEISLGEIEIDIPDGVFLENKEKISIGAGTIIEPGVYIRGPCKIGKNCKILQGAYLREGVILEEGAVIGHACEVKNSLFLSGAKASHFNYIGDSILGFHTNLGAGVKCANLRLDKKEIIIRINQTNYPTSLSKMGVVLGDRSQIGCNSVCNPGTLIGKEVWCPPGMVLQGSFPSFTKIVSEKIIKGEG